MGCASCTADASNVATCSSDNVQWVYTLCTGGAKCIEPSGPCSGQCAKSCKLINGRVVGTSYTTCSAKDKSSKAVCQSDGSWKNVKCPVGSNCNSKNGKVECKCALKNDTVVNPGYETCGSDQNSRAVCQPDGSWKYIKCPVAKSCTLKSGKASCKCELLNDPSGADPGCHRCNGQVTWVNVCLPNGTWATPPCNSGRCQQGSGKCTAKCDGVTAKSEGSGNGSQMVSCLLNDDNIAEVGCSVCDNNKVDKKTCQPDGTWNTVKCMDGSRCSSRQGACNAKCLLGFSKDN